MRNTHKDYYRNLSRKEIQGLCKKNGLCAIGTTSHLVKLLLSFFKGNHTSPPPSEKKRITGLVEVNPPSHPANLQSEPPLNLLKVADKDTIVHKRSGETSGADTCGPSTCSNQKEGYGNRTSQTINQDENSSYQEARDAYKVHDSSGNVVPELTTINQSKEACSCPSFDSGKVGIQLEGLTNPQETNYRKNDSSNFVLRNFGLTGTVQQDQSRNIDFGAHPTKSGQVSSNRTSAEVPPFQFFVSSEEGINLVVDLSSSPSKWIKSLKEEVCIYQKEHQKVLRRGLRDQEELVKTSVGCTEKEVQTRKVDRRIDFGCSQSSLSLVMRESPLSVASEECIPIERPSEQNNRVVSSRCDLNEETVPPIFDTSIGNCTHNLYVSVNAAGSPLPGPLDGWMGIGRGSAKTLFGGLPNTFNNASEKTETREVRSPPDIGTLRKHSGICEGSSTSVSSEMQLSRFMEQGDDISGPPGFDNPMGSVQSENMDLGNYHLDKGTCSLKEQGRNTVADGKESLDSEFGNSSDTTSKRTHEKEICVDLPGKRRQNNNETHEHVCVGPLVKKLGGKRYRSREKSLPRRSKRLGSK